MDDLAVRLRMAAATIEEMQALRGAEEELDQVLARLAETGRRVITGATGVSVTVLSEGRRPWTAAATDDAVTTIDREQYATDQGPCLEAARTRRPVRAGLDEVRVRWPAFARAAEGGGMRSYLSAPLLLDDEPMLGSLNVYGRTADAFHAADEALGVLITAAASAAIVNSRRHRRARELVDDMRVAMTSRAEIEQAKGVLMAQHGLTADAAFTMLVTRSQNDNTKLRRIARSLLDSVSPEGG